MRRSNFATKQKRELLKNKYICKVNNYTVTFTAEFKLYAVKQHKLWCISRLIFKEAGIPDWFNRKRYAKGCLRRWRKVYDKKKSFSKKALKALKAPDSKSLSKMDKKELTARVSYLEAENDFLKKLKALETI